MSEIVLREVANRKDLKAFVKFPFSLYKDNDYWVPPLIMDEMEIFNPDKNSSYEYCESKLWLAYKNDTIVGRIAGIKHGPEFENEKKIRFGRIDFIDDPEVSTQLINAVKKWGSEIGAEHMHGPLGFNDTDFLGLLTSGFERRATIATTYNHPYYEHHFSELGFTEVTEWIELSADFEPRIPKKLERAASYVSDRFGLKSHQLKNSKEFHHYGQQMFETLNAAYDGLYGFYPLIQKEIDALLDKYQKFLKPDNICLVLNEENIVIAFAIAMPSLSVAFQKAKGRLLPTGLFHIVKALFFNKEFDLYLIGVHP